MSVRRVVTGKVGGKSKIVSDGGTRRSRAFKNIPGQSAALLWSTSAAPAAPGDGADIISEKSSYLPQQPGETRLMHLCSGFRDDEHRSGRGFPRICGACP